MPSTKDRKEYFREYQKAYYERHKDEIMKRRQERWQTQQGLEAWLAEQKAEKKADRLRKDMDPDFAVMWQRARARARQAGQAFKCQAKNVTIPERCPVLGVRLVHKLDSRHEQTPTLVMLDPERGWEDGNVAVVSRRAADIRGEFSADELRRAAEWVRAVRVGER